MCGLSTRLKNQGFARRVRPRTGKICGVKIRIRYRHNPREVKRDLSRFFSMSLTLLAMLVVALLSALVSMRLAIHAGEVEVPNLAGLTLDEASAQTSKAKLNLGVENRFYSTTVPAGRVLSQSPLPGVSVRKGWHMRITESIGPQRVDIPDTVGMTERDAAMAVRRASLDLGTLSRLPAPGASDIVLAQTPPANAEGVDKPQVSLLLSTAETPAAKAFVMPNLVGISFSAASAKMREMDLRLWAIVPQAAAGAETTSPAGAAPAVALVPAGVVVTQAPAAGMRVTAADSPHVKMSAGAAPSSPSPSNGAERVSQPAPVVRLNPSATQP